MGSVDSSGDILAETLAVFDGVEPPSTPLTTSEVADSLDCTRRAAYDRLDRLVEQGDVETKKVGARGRVWWRPRASDRKGEETDSQNYEERFRKILETCPVGIIVFSQDDGIVRTNSYAVEILGASEDNIDEYSMDDWEVHDSTGERLSFEEWPAIQALKTGEPVSDTEVEIVGIDGVRKWVSVDATPLKEGEDGFEQVVATLTDITQLKEQARRLKRQRNDLKHELDEVFDRVDDAVLALDDEWRFDYVNEQAEEFLDTKESELLGQTVWDLFPDAKAYNGYDVFRQAVEHQRPESFEEYYEPFDAWLEVHVYPSETGVSVYFRDVTERKEREHELERYETIVETIWDGVYALDPDERFVGANKAFMEMAGYEREELMGEPASIVHSESLNDTAAELSHEVQVGERDGASLEFELVKSNGETIPVESRFGPYRYGDDRFARTGVVRDITERRRFEQTLKSLHHSARSLLGARSKDEVSEIVVETATDVLDLPGVIVYRLNDDEMLIPDRRSVETGFIRQEFPELPPDESSITGHVFAEGESRYFEDIRESSSLEVDTSATEMRSGLFVPMSDQGILIVGSRAIGAFDDETQQLVELLAANAEVAYDRVEHERRLEESEQRYRTLVERFPDGSVALFDHDLRYTLVEGELYSNDGFEPQEFTGVRVGELHASPEIGELLESNYRAALDGETRKFEFDCGEQTFQAWSLPVTDDDRDVFAGMAVIQDITERVQRERKLNQQREQLAALNDLNAVVREINDALVQQSTREEIEQVVCERLAESDSYQFAWISEIDAKTRSITPRVEAGVDGYLDEIPLSTDPEEPTSRGPTGKAIRTKKMQITRDVDDDPDFEPWREYAKEYGYSSAAAIPVIHEDTLYGVLGVYTERTDAFTSDERDVIGHLGEIIGHAIAAVERKQALMSDEIVEVELRISDVFETVGIEAPTDDSITVERSVPIGDGTYLEYGTATDETRDVLETLVDHLPHWEELTILDEKFGDIRFELRLSEPPVISTVASHGGHIERVVVGDGDFLMTIQLPPSVELRRVIDTVQLEYPTAEMVTRRQVTRPDTSSNRAERVFTEELTDRQRVALEAAYHSGFFEWPRNSSGEDIADSLGVSAPTFHQHVRLAEKKLFEALFAEPTVGGE
ncbi:PAS domain S-box protein [Haladaptatus sp. NG-SE-30]